MSIRFDGRVAIVTGAGGGLGRLHALALAARGAAVLVNDLGGALDGRGGSSGAAQAVVDEIRAAGGRAIASGASVTDFAAVEAMVAAAMQEWGRVDILVNNAGILRDKSFAKMELADFRLVMDVHLMGAVHCTKAVWDIMRERNYGRIVMTTSSSGLFGNFGQANYGAAKMALVGLMQTLSIEGAKHNIRVNCLAPTAATRMTENLMPEAALKRLVPEAVTPGADRARRRRRADAGHSLRRSRRLRARLGDADAGRAHRPSRRCRGAHCRRVGSDLRSRGRDRSRQRPCPERDRARQGDARARVFLGVNGNLGERARLAVEGLDQIGGAQGSVAFAARTRPHAR